MFWGDYVGCRDFVDFESLHICQVESSRGWLSQVRFKKVKKNQQFEEIFVFVIATT